MVFGHAFNVESLIPAQQLFNPVFLLTSSGTVIFVLIAGILFRMKAVPRLIAGQTRVREILRRRWAELSGVYLTVGMFLALVFSLKVGLEGGSAPFVFARMMLNGSMAHSYWYVPFFLLLMVLTPLHVWFSRRDIAVQIGLVLSGSLLSAFIHRPDHEAILGAVHALVYYLPVFWFGLIIGARWQAVLTWLHGKELLLAAAFGLMIIAQTAIGQTTAYLHPLGEGWGKLDLFIPQKLLFALVFMSVFQRTKDLSMPVLDWLAENSLTIFFMHPAILFLLLQAPHLSGFYVPELLLFTVVMIFAGMQLYRLLLRVFARLPSGISQLGQAIRTASLPAS